MTTNKNIYTHLSLLEGLQGARREKSGERPRKSSGRKILPGFAASGVGLK
jgi:hypothetical protein